MHAAIRLVTRPSQFLEIFSRPNLLSLPSGAMCWLAGAYAIAGVVFSVSAIQQMTFSPKARRVFLFLVGPCTMLYPVVMANLTYTSGLLLQSAWGGFSVLFPFGVLVAVGYVYFGLTDAAPNGGETAVRPSISGGPPSVS